MSSDDLSWLIYPTAINPDPIIDHDPTEQVGNTTVVATEDIVHPPPQTTLVLSKACREQSEQEVILEPLIDIANDVPSTESPHRFELPQEVREVFHQGDMTLSLKHDSPINQGNVDNVSQSTVAFNVALYSSYIPRNTEEALHNPNERGLWKIIALKRNTWEKCMLPKGKKTVGSRSNTMPMGPLRDTKPDL